MKESKLKIRIIKMNKIKEDINNIKIANKIWKEIERGEFRKFTEEEFKKEIENW